MIPKKNGRELCKALKNDERTSHIPVILLTALAEKEDKLQGLAVGADDYLVKPFDAQELLVRVRNLLENRSRMRDAYGRTIRLTPGEISVLSLDDAFLKKTITIVNAHLSDQAFSVEQFSHEIFLSRTQLQRKLKALTNLTPGDFIRNLRLQRAKELLEINSGTIAEIADSVGFTNHSYFAKCFQEQFGLLPNQVRRQQK
jgi:DNA-binding response OmpR family regulator